MFSIKFNKYLKERKCSAKKLSEITQISEPTISRYRSGKTVPSLESGNIESIAKALAELPGSDETRDDIYEDLLVAAYEDLELVDYEIFSEKLSSLIDRLNINQSKLADAIPISSSHLSKICHNQIKPRNPVWIAENAAHYVTYNYPDEAQYAIVQNLIWGSDADKNSFSSSEDYFRQLKKWLLMGKSTKSILVDNLLHKYGEYDITHYLPYPKKTDGTHPSNESIVRGNDSQLFMGTEGLKEAFFTWVEIACHSKVNDEIFMFDEVFSELARQDYKTCYDYVAAVEKLIRNGKKITFVNNLHNDLYLAAKKMLVWLPLTMSKRVNNYYLNESKENLYKNLILISSDAALIGNIIDDDYDNGYYSLIRSAPEILIARQRAHKIMRRAECSNLVFDNRKDFENDLLKNLFDMKNEEPLHIYLPVPPLATMSEDLLKRILKRNNISPAMTTHIIERHRKEKHIRDILVHDQTIDVTLNYIDYNSWHDKPIYVGFNDRNSDLNLTYDYDEYQEHLELTSAYAMHHDNIQLHLECLNFYENMLVVFIPGRYGAVTTLRNMPVDASSDKKIIVDSMMELLYVITPSNYPQVIKNEKERELLDFFKKLMQREP